MAPRKPLVAGAYPAGPPAPTAPGVAWDRAAMVCTASFSVGFDVFPQEEAAGEVLEAQVLGALLAHGALAPARRSEERRRRAGVWGPGLREEERGGQRAGGPRPRETPGASILLLPTRSAQVGTGWPPPRPPQLGLGALTTGGVGGFLIQRALVYCTSLY